MMYVNLQMKSKILETHHYNITALVVSSLIHSNLVLKNVLLCTLTNFNYYKT